jgi:hypothetical protein
VRGRPCWDDKTIRLIIVPSREEVCNQESGAIDLGFP